MNEILGIEIPADLGALSTSDLRTFARTLRDAAKAAALGDVDPTILAEIEAAKAKVIEARDVLTARAEADASLAERREALLAELDTEDPVLGDEAEEDLGDEAEDDETDETEGEDLGDEAEEVDGEDEAITAGLGRYRPTASAVARHSRKGPDTPPPSARRAARFKAKSGVSGYEAGQEFESQADLGRALHERWKDIAHGGTDKIRVATLEGRFTEAQILTGDPSADEAKFGGYDPHNVDMDALTAAVCAPREPIYDSVNAVSSSTARPVRGPMATYRPARGGVSLYPTPKLSDVEGGIGIWDRADDANTEAVKEACATIPCGSPVNYDIYGIYRCLTVKNMNQLTYPELVNAYLNRLQALQANLAETTLLDAMLGSTNLKALTATANAYGASINLFSSIANLVAIAREEERLGDQMFDAWLPRWTIPALQIDLLNQRRTSGRLSDRIVSVADIVSALRDLGIDPTFTMDLASTWSPVPTVDDGDVLPSLPTDFDMIISPKGNFRALDRGTLDIGVTNNVVRDNDSNARNQFTMFWESFEGLMDWGAVSYGLTIEGVCFGGAQTADVTSITCPAGSGS